ncbi:TlpA disulfide reductase family protein [Mucilaginibacter kameinonensis]|uniref:TlpA disulfide reductase family protein n=1 Tax=Mucilaginibacter kameinonensis TaxID=452286 RepID=UPI000EF85180|nr:TlpA disulfide reductase family protein [Mucilaginibacter kameinonensis]
MKKPYYIILLMLIGLFSCKQDNTVTIRGNIKGLKSKWVYYKPTFPIGGKSIDSAKVTDGKFEFNFRPDTAFFADIVSLSYKDEKGKREYIAVGNPNEPAKNHSRYVDFVVGTGVTTITGDLSKTEGAILNGGSQSESYLKNITLPYIRISKDSVRRAAQTERIKKIISENPDSYWSLSALHNFRFYVEHAQLIELYNSFGDAARTSYYGRKLKQFIDNQPANKSQFANSIFNDVDEKPVNLVDNTKKLNMVIFWASWCGPCRQEIPSLKRIAAQFNKDDIRFVSVSVDEKKENWLTVMKAEDMPWQQLIIPRPIFQKAQVQYNLGFVPQVYLVNNKNIVVKKIDGFNEGNEERVKTFIADYLAKN